ncbi:hypothetical protein CI109_104785 [Kwoniella shandongensis]|uniref:Uncharacterized protein n=1 Tax=Kwoniella shandongensis TaxID=1734106 RepID=A0A5M6BRT9_9TREE|nr:uncharacterized protein CI109_006870 [Kwoniella shandongensis]KAA5524782.1 hypothetical protein CI109_006870 [Kwoniella shandongensis]
MSLRATLRPLTTRLSLTRSFQTTTLRSTTAGYGDPQDEKADNYTPTPASTADPQPNGQGQGVGQKSGTTDPEVGKVTGNAGGEKGAGSKEKEDVSGQEIKETKKVGEEPKKEEVGGSGPIGG